MKNEQILMKQMSSQFPNPLLQNHYLKNENFNLSLRENIYKASLW